MKIPKILFVLLIILSFLVESTGVGYLSRAQSRDALRPMAAAININSPEFIWLDIHGFIKNKEQKEETKEKVKKQIAAKGALVDKHNIEPFVTPEEIRSYVKHILEKKGNGSHKIILSGHYLIASYGAGCIELAIGGICDAFGTEGFELLLPLDLIDNSEGQEYKFSDFLDILLFTKLNKSNCLVFLDDKIVDEWNVAATTTEHPAVVRFYTSSQNMLDSFNVAVKASPDIIDNGLKSLPIPEKLPELNSAVSTAFICAA